MRWERLFTVSILPSPVPLFFCFSPFSSFRSPFDVPSQTPSHKLAPNSVGQYTPGSQDTPCSVSCRVYSLPHFPFFASSNGSFFLGKISRGHNHIARRGSLHDRRDKARPRCPCAFLFWKYSQGGPRPQKASLYSRERRH